MKIKKTFGQKAQTSLSLTENVNNRLAALGYFYNDEVNSNAKSEAAAEFRKSGIAVGNEEDILQPRVVYTHANHRNSHAVVVRHSFNGSFLPTDKITFVKRVYDTDNMFSQALMDVKDVAETMKISEFMDATRPHPVAQKAQGMLQGLRDYFKLDICT